MAGVSLDTDVTVIDLLPVFLDSTEHQSILLCATRFVGLERLSNK